MIYNCLNTEGNDLAIHISISPGTRRRNKVNTIEDQPIPQTGTLSQVLKHLCQRKHTLTFLAVCASAQSTTGENRQVHHLCKECVFLFDGEYMFGGGECFLGGVHGKEHTCQCRRHKRCIFNPWVMKIPWRKACQPTLVFLPGKSHGQKSVAG